MPPPLIYMEIRCAVSTRFKCISDSLAVDFKNKLLFPISVNIF